MVFYREDFTLKVGINCALYTMEDGRVVEIFFIASPSSGPIHAGKLGEVKEKKKRSVAFKELREYFEGKRKLFTVKVEFLWGTMFQKKVWKALLKVRYGKTKTYSDIAQAIQHPQALRAVGSAVAQNPVPILVPCHRIVPRKGGIGNFQAGPEKKQLLLNLEQNSL